MAARKKKQVPESERPIPLMVRLPPQLHALVETAAKRQHRSLNAQLIHVVSYYFGGDDDERTVATDTPT